MTGSTIKFTTTIGNATPARNRINAAFRKGLNNLYDNFGGDLGDAIQLQFPDTPISQSIDVASYSSVSTDAPPRPGDVGVMNVTWVFAEFQPPATEGFYADVNLDISNTTIDPTWFIDTLMDRWDPENFKIRATTDEQQAVNGGVTSISLIDTGDVSVFIVDTPGFPQHLFAGQ